MNAKVQSLLEQLEGLTPVDYALLSRVDLIEVSNAAFPVTSAAEAELEQRRGWAPWTHALQGHH